ncbi:MAG: flavodoxin family protein [Planctomycetaceae bacterium]|nr:flavodoxin family protein [Planctomycetaceae bacterium]
MSETKRRDFLKQSAFTISGVLGAGAAASTMASTVTAQTSGTQKRKIIGINTSHRVGKTCAESLQIVLNAIKAADASLETELLELATMNFGFPVVTGEQPVDDLDGVLAKITAADCAGIVVASPVYFGLPSSRCVALINRLSPIRKVWGLKNKILGLVAVASGRNGGQETVLHAMCNSLVAQQMILAVDGPPTSHWGGTLWNQNDTVSADEPGIATAKNLGTRIAELAKMV